MDLITPKIGLIFWTFLTFVFLFFVLKKFAWKPILKSVNDREDSIKDALDTAENAKREMANLQADNERILKEARLERENMLKEARELKTKMIADAKDEAQAQASKMIAQAQIAIDSEKKNVHQVTDSSFRVRNDTRINTSLYSAVVSFILILKVVIIENTVRPGRSFCSPS